MLETKIVAALGGREFPSVTRERHRGRLREAETQVSRALGALDCGAELAAEDLRLASRALGRVSGRIDPEELLDRIFASFCIGK
jgi:tRNA modification GTPase